MIQSIQYTITCKTMWGKCDGISLYAFSLHMFWFVTVGKIHPTLGIPCFCLCRSILTAAPNGHESSWSPPVLSVLWQGKHVLWTCSLSSVFIIRELRKDRSRILECNILISAQVKSNPIYWFVFQQKHLTREEWAKTYSESNMDVLEVRKWNNVFAEWLRYKPSQ